MKTTLRQRLINNAKRNAKKMNPKGRKLSEIIAERQARAEAYRAEKAKRVAERNAADKGEK